MSTNKQCHVPDLFILKRFVLTRWKFGIWVYAFYLIFYRFHILLVCWCYKPNGAYRFVKSCSTDHNKLITNAQYITPTFLSRYYFTRDLHISGSSNNTTCRLIWLFTISVRYINQLILILIATFNSFTRQSRYRDKMQKGIFDATFILEESFDAYTRY